ncbi:hypothetical protein [Chryseosolibacter indicus]|uniref:DUF4369 domain-containing protein n=1 Tax=Chryseosolibacter indicus TaxID=2782351 RepID=A0ABS5VPP2_9BACT|nr:hypothetical protein [Chryseosolibacter indicus]MBT1703311.1 hypothetical protein [Chryseosolibacter indicus]
MRKFKLTSTGFFFLAVILLTKPVLAQKNWPSEVWHEGKLVLLEGDTLRGMLKYDLQQDLVQYVIKDNKPEVFTARKVLFFEIFDESVHKYRQFFALPFNTVGGYKTPIFFELLEEGKITLLTREYLEYKTISSPYYFGSYTTLVLSHKYYFLKENGSIEEFVGNKNNLLNMMGSRDEEVEKYIKANRLRYDDKYDMAKIVAYYNSLTGS